VRRPERIFWAPGRVRWDEKPLHKLTLPVQQ